MAVEADLAMLSTPLFKIIAAWASISQLSQDECLLARYMLIPAKYFSAKHRLLFVGGVMFSQIKITAKDSQENLRHPVQTLFFKSLADLSLSVERIS